MGNVSESFLPLFIIPLHDCAAATVYTTRNSIVQYYIDDDGFLEESQALLLLPALLCAEALPARRSASPSY